MKKLTVLLVAAALSGCAGGVEIEPKSGIGENTYFDRPHPSHIEGEAWRDGKVVRP